MNNLPTPMSRIEELIYAFITRDMSKVSEPKSRIEEYWYHILTGTNTLPVPKSRVEELYKRLIENNTIDIPVPLSRIEEFLIALLTSGTVSFAPKSRIETYLNYMLENNIGIQNVEYLEYTGTNITATNTIEAPIKSAILKGNTLVNLWKSMASDVVVQQKVDDTIIESDYSEQYTKVTFGADQVNAATTCGMYTAYQLESNKTYYINTFVFDDSNVDSFLVRDDANSINLTTNPITGYPKGQILSFTTEYSTDRLLFYYFANTRKYGMSNYGKPFYMPKQFIISDKLEDVVNKELFTGMQSVKMPVLTTTGKNIFNPTKSWNSNQLNYTVTDGTILINGTCEKINDMYIHNLTDTLSEKMNSLKVGTSLTISNSLGKPNYFGVTRNGKDIWSLNTITIQNGDSNIRCFVRFDVGESYNNQEIKVQLEQGTVATPFEPYKSNTLSTPSDLVLRGIGDVKDTLDVNTGEVVQRIGEVIFDGSEAWTIGKTSVNTVCFQVGLSSLNINVLKNNFITNYLIKNVGLWGSDVECATINGSFTHFQIRLNKTKASTVDEVKQYLNQNPLTVHLELASPIIKTVDLSIIDQDNNPVNWMSAFKDTTYIESLTTAENSLAGEVMVEVPTKVEDAYNAVQILLEGCKTSLVEIDEIQNEQEMDSILVMNSQAELYDLILSNQGGDIL